MTREFFHKVLTTTHGKAYITRKYKYRVYHVGGLTKIVQFDKQGQFKSIVAVYPF